VRKLLNKPWFVALLAIAALVFVGQAFLPRRTVASATSPAPSNDVVADAEGNASGATPSPASLPEALKALPIPAVLRDPFALPAKPVEVVAVETPAEPDFVDTVHLTAVWSQEGATLALINGHIFQPGDKLGRLKIESANADGIWLTHWKGRDFVSVGGSFSLNTPAASGATDVSSL
jgi:hypothetical protein